MIYLSFFRKKIFFFLFIFLLLTCKKNTIEGAHSQKLPEGVDPFEILKIQVDGADCFEIKTADEGNFIRILFADDNFLSQFNARGLTEKNIQLHPGVQLEKINFSTYRLSYQGKYRDYFLSSKITELQDYSLTNALIYEQNAPDFFLGSLEIFDQEKKIQGILVDQKKEDLIAFLQKIKLPYAHCQKFSLEENQLHLSFGTKNLTYNLDLEEVSASVFNLEIKKHENLIYSQIVGKEIDLVLESLENITISDYFVPESPAVSLDWQAPYLQLNYKKAKWSYQVNLEKYLDDFLTPELSPTQPQAIIHAEIDEESKEIWVVTGTDFDHQQNMPSFSEFRPGVKVEGTAKSFSLVLGKKRKDYFLIGEKFDPNWLIPSFKNPLPEGIDQIGIKNDTIFIEGKEKIPLVLDWFVFEEGVKAYFNENQTELVVSFGNFKEQEKKYGIDFSYQNAWKIEQVKLLDIFGQIIPSIFQSIKEPSDEEMGEIQLRVAASYLDQIDELSAFFSTSFDLETEFVKTKLMAKNFNYQQIGFYKVGIKAQVQQTYRVMLEVWDEKKWIADDFSLFNSAGTLVDYFATGTRKVDHENAMITATIRPSGYLTDKYTIKANPLLEGIVGEMKNAVYDPSSQTFTADYILSYEALGLNKTYQIVFRKL